MFKYHSSVESMADSFISAGLPGFNHPNLRLLDDAARDRTYNTPVSMFFGTLARLATLEEEKMQSSLPEGLLQSFPAAAVAASGLYLSSGRQYSESIASRGLAHPSVVGDNIWTDFDQARIEGRIEPLRDEGLWYPPALATTQVLTADYALSRYPSSVLAGIASGNYQTWGPEMMADIKTTLAGLSDPNKPKDFESMPWLQLTNESSSLVLGEVNKYLLGKKGALHVFELGAGTGPGIATMLRQLAISKGAKGEGLGADRISFTAIETTPQFGDAISRYMLDENTIVMLKELGLTFDDATDDFMELQRGEARLIRGDILGSLAKGDYSEVQHDDICYVNLNYVAHRIPMLQKAEIIDEFTKMSDNTIVVVSDLWENSSEVNRGYFDLSTNGPLNAGNIGLENLLRDKGFTVLTLTKDFRPDYISEDILNQVATQLENDGKVVIAYRGSKAAEALGVIRK